ncbi:MAG: hypothetical protein ACOXZK_09310 [Bacteroidales bacterium]|jgi:hypothetical protein|nr:hypothetical protein [Bacteroidales bacterium]
MKKLSFLCACIIYINSINAQIIALHHEGETQIFKGNTSFAQAYESSQNGDTLYFSGGTYFPPSKIEKELTLFGAGHYQDSTLVTGKTIISGDVVLENGANNFYIEGFQITGRLRVSTNHTISGLTCKRNRITSTIDFVGNQSNPSSNIAIIGSVFSGGDFQYAENVLVNNCIISNGRFIYSYGNSFSNNIILYSYYSSSAYVFSASNNNNISNNIIHRSDGYSNNVATGDGNVFYNNLFSMATPNLGNNPSTLNNQYNIEMLDFFVNQTGVDFNYSHDYHLSEPTQYMGTDGTQVGIYGGIFPYKEGAVPLNPHIQINNSSSSTDSYGNLPVYIQVKAQKDID